MNKNMLHTLTAVELIQLLKNRDTTVFEVAESFIKRTNTIDPVVHAWVSINEEYILSQAHKINHQFTKNISLPLFGMPVGIKDIFNTEFYPTQKGSLLWKDYKSGNDARCVSYLRQAGAVIFGKTDTAELAVHANPNTLNPYHLAHVTGTSSGGSAAVVSTAMAPLALGSQTGGSIIRPGSWCGVYAMKPSFGLIPRTGVLKTTDTLDSIGFFARCVEDMKLLLDTLRVHGDNFPVQEKKIKNYSNFINKKKWKVAFCNHHLIKQTKNYVQDSLEAFKKNLVDLNGIEVTTLDLPELTKGCHDLHRRIYHPCLAYYLKTEVNKDQDKVSHILKEIFEDAKTIPPEDYKVALNEQAILAAEIEQFFLENGVDILLMNSSDGSAPHGSEPCSHNDLNPLWTMTWLPVINVPQFKCPQRLPFGLQVIGPRFSDYKVLAFLDYLKANGVIPQQSEIASVFQHQTELLNAV